MALESVNMVGNTLASLGMVTWGNNSFLQTSGNCFEIAFQLARRLGYSFFSSRRELEEAILLRRQLGLWGNTPLKQGPSLAYAIIRQSDNPTDVHVTLEYRGREYNYGPGKREGFVEEDRIPLRRLS